MRKDAKRYVALELPSYISIHREICHEPMYRIFFLHNLNPFIKVIRTLLKEICIYLLHSHNEMLDLYVKL